MCLIRNQSAKVEKEKLKVSHGGLFVFLRLCKNPVRKHIHYRILLYFIMKHNLLYVLECSSVEAVH